MYINSEITKVWDKNLTTPAATFVCSPGLYVTLKNFQGAGLSWMACDKKVVIT